MITKNKLDSSVIRTYAKNDTFFLLYKKRKKGYTYCAFFSHYTKVKNHHCSSYIVLFDKNNEMVYKTKLLNSSNLAEMICDEFISKGSLTRNDIKIIEQKFEDKNKERDERIEKRVNAMSNLKTNLKLDENGNIAKI